MKNESYFDGGLLQLIGWRILGGLITLVTLGICYPWAVCMIYNWEVKHTVIDGKRQYFDGKSFDGGRSKWCVCPFHDDKHASLHVYEKIAICEVCGRIDFEDIKKHFNIGV